MMRQRGTAVPSERQQGIDLIWMNPRWKPKASLNEAERIVSWWQFLKRLIEKGKVQS